METIAVIAQKGGVGKTTTAHALGTGLAKYHGAKVLFIDMDAQGNLSRTMEADRSGISGKDILSFITGQAAAEECIQHTAHGDIIASTPALSGAYTLPELSKVGREYRLKKALESISGGYDFCIIDTPPALSILTVNALTACRRVIIPTQADDYSLDSLSALQKTIETVREYCNSSLQVDGILITRYNARTVLSREIGDMIGQAAAGMGTRLYSTRIRENTAIKEAQALREDIYSYSPRSNGAKDYKALLEELMA